MSSLDLTLAGRKVLTPDHRNRLLAGLTTYRYEYAGNFSNVSPLSWMGAYHSCQFLFSPLPRRGLKLTRI